MERAHVSSSTRTSAGAATAFPWVSISSATAGTAPGQRLDVDPVRHLERLHREHLPGPGLRHPLRRPGFERLVRPLVEDRPRARPDHDRVYLSYRKYPKGAKIFPFKPKQADAGGMLEVLTILPKPAQIRLPGRNAEYDAPAGMFWRAVPLEARAGHRRGCSRRQSGRAAGESGADHRSAVPRAERADLLFDGVSPPLEGRLWRTPSRCCAASTPTTTTTACRTGSRCTGTASSWTGPRPPGRSPGHRQGREDQPATLPGPDCAEGPPAN